MVFIQVLGSGVFYFLVFVPAAWDSVYFGIVLWFKFKIGLNLIHTYTYIQQFNLV